jgi:hypothetical protein
MVKGQKRVKLMQPKDPRWWQGTGPFPTWSPTDPLWMTSVNFIRTTGVLNVAIRSDSPLFGYINTNRQWTGYCFDLVAAVETSLEAMAGMPAAD